MARYTQGADMAHSKVWHFGYVLPTETANLAAYMRQRKVKTLMKKKTKKKIFSLALVICCLAVMAISGTMAHYSADNVTTNVITTNKIDIDLVEMAVDSETGEEVAFVDVTGVLPGQTVSKIARVNNTEFARPAWVRITVDKDITLAEDKEGEIDLSLIRIDFNLDDWTARTENGVVWYYYNKPLEVDDTTAPLFENVEFSGKMGNIYENAQVVITVTAQAVQTKNNGTSAFTALGWPELQ